MKKRKKGSIYCICIMNIPAIELITGKDLVLKSRIDKPVSIVSAEKTKQLKHKICREWKSLLQKHSFCSETHKIGW